MIANNSTNSENIGCQVSWWKLASI